MQAVIAESPSTLGFRVIVSPLYVEVPSSGHKMRTFRCGVHFRQLAALMVCLLTLPAAKAITFKSPPVIPTASDVLLLVTADVNGDGKPDLVYVDGPQYNQRAAHVLLNNGNGTFTHGQDIGLPAGVCCSLTVADVTGDGKVDLLFLGSNSTSVIVAVFPGNGDGTFGTPVLTTYTPTGFDGYPGFGPTIGVGDINSDGRADLVVLDTSEGGYAIDLLLGNGSGSFTYEQTLQAYITPSSVAPFELLDLNGDGHPDIFVADALGADFYVFLGNGDGTFAAPTHYSLNTPAGPFLLADIDGDGHPDVVTVYYPSGDITPGVFYQLGYLKGNPDGTFSSLVDLGNSPSQGNPLVAAVDLNGDGIPDLVFDTPSGLAVSLGGTGPSFAASTLTTICGGSMSPYSSLPVTPVVADFNGDGHVDIAMAVEGGIVLLFGNGDGTFISDTFYDMGQPVGAAAVAQFSGSGNMDIAVTLPATYPRLLLGDGKGNFTLGPDPNPSYGSQAPAYSVYAADFNGDGKPDLNVGTALPNVSIPGAQSIQFNLGNGTFSAPISVANSSPIMADFNRDGRMDMVAVSGLQAVVSLGQSNNSFEPVTTNLHVPFNESTYNAGDVNNDGKPDLVLNYSDHLEIWLGNGDGTFSFFASIALQPAVYAGVTVGDVDGDGNADIILAPSSSNYLEPVSPLTIFYGNGNGTFQPPAYIPVRHAYTQIIIADLNGDKLPDLVMSDGATIAVMMNLGGRQFDSEVDYVAGRSMSVVNVVDVNGDGYPDVVVANGDGYVGSSGPNYSGTTVIVLLNEPNANPSSGASVTGTLSVAPEPSIAGQPFTITLSVSPQSGSGPVPTGAVGFSVDGIFSADASVQNGSASYSYTGSLIPGQHTITAMYNGDSTYAPKSFSTNDNIDPPTYATNTILVVSPSTILASNTIRLTATVTSPVSVPAGVVTFLDGGNVIGSADINSGGAAQFDTNLLAPGSHTLSAQYQGYTQIGYALPLTYIAAIFSPSTSAPVPVNVTADATTVSLSASSTSATSGTVLTFAAQVTSNAGTPFGGVSFYDGSELLGTLALNAQGQVSFSTASLSAGAHSIQAAFNANGPYGGALSSPQNISINAAPGVAIATYVALALQTDSSGGKWLQATVSSGNSSSSGRVTFLDSGGILGTAPLNSSGVAVLAIPEFAGGQHVLTASYGGTSALAPSVSPAFTEEWSSAGPGFSLQVVPQPAKSSSEVSLKVNLLPTGNFQQSVTLSCANGVPAGYRCEFSPSVLSGGHEDSTLLILPAPQGTSSLFAGLVFLPLLFAAFLFQAGATNRYWWSSLVLMVCCCIGSLTGCSNAMPPTRLTVVTVQASASTGSEVIIHSFQLIVKLPAKR